MIQEELELFKLSVEIPEGAALIDKVDAGDQVDLQYLLSVSESDAHITKKFLHIRHFKSTGETHSNKTTEKYQKFLCVNGPYVNQMMTEDQAGEEYCRYNCSQRRRNWTPNVLVWKGT